MGTTNQPSLATAVDDKKKRKEKKKRRAKSERRAEEERGEEKKGKKVEKKRKEGRTACLKGAWCDSIAKDSSSEA